MKTKNWKHSHEKYTPVQIGHCRKQNTNLMWKRNVSVLYPSLPLGQRTSYCGNTPSVNNEQLCTAGPIRMKSYMERRCVSLLPLRLSPFWKKLTTCIKKPKFALTVNSEHLSTADSYKRWNYIIYKKDNSANYSYSLTGTRVHTITKFTFPSFNTN